MKALQAAVFGRHRDILAGYAAVFAAAAAGLWRP
jgi:hypothetical protein